MSLMSLLLHCKPVMNIGFNLQTTFLLIMLCKYHSQLLCDCYVLAFFYVSLNSIYCVVVSSLLFSPSIYESCFVICLQLPPPRLVHKLFAGGKIM